MSMNICVCMCVYVRGDIYWQVLARLRHRYLGIDNKVDGYCTPEISTSGSRRLNQDPAAAWTVLVSPGS